ncbi:DUF6954 family protein [Sedimentibacter sp. MB31-C6]|uniref:DUF6954 family protein n=1 Tax=Sedimentibacter sp. MB31-C6 TaxID=3109366 RepID=UPI002DDDB8E8|nr:hypothetical protein [Sedimentibacter sp. MB36-C1]WSI02941.1 hypothetical protein U8307_07740 [Sedimentibacter sp. MB36-C1]
MKTKIGILITAMIGFVLGFFGVIVSIFADGDIFEKLNTAFVILLIYGALSCILGLLYKSTYKKFVITLSLPGIVFLIIYLFSEFNIMYIGYMFLILTTSFVGGSIGKKIHN